MEDVLALFIPLIPITVASLWLLGKTTIGKAIARRIEGRSGVRDQELDVLHDELDRLREQIALMQGEQSQMLDRLEFTERLLSRGRESGGE
jgi:hypothetical protein